VSGTSNRFLIAGFIMTACFHLFMLDSTRAGKFHRLHPVGLGQPGVGARVEFRVPRVQGFEGLGFKGLRAWGLRFRV
jgi:hypothetical protein